MGKKLPLPQLVNAGFQPSTVPEAINQASKFYPSKIRKKRTPLPITWNPLGCLPRTVVRCLQRADLCWKTIRHINHSVILLMLQKSGYTKNLENNGIKHIPQLVNTGFLVTYRRIAARHLFVNIFGS